MASNPRSTRTRTAASRLLSAAQGLWERVRVSSDFDLGKVSGNTMCSSEKLRNLRAIGQQLSEAGISGDVVECGVFKGGSSAMIALALGRSVPRDFWLYDSFEGLPAPTPADGSYASKYIGTCKGSEAAVKEVFESIEFPESRLHLCKGWFHESFPKFPKPEAIAVLHIDADWHESVTLALDHFYDRVVTGGAVILDDFGFWEGCREAFYDFCARTGEKPLLERCGPDQAYWFKGQAHRRGTPTGHNAPLP